jgi:outer membrane biogenesis lipoprotein LolB
MKKFLVFTLIFTSLIFSGCSLTKGLGQANSTSTTTDSENSPSGSTSENLTNLQSELNQTIDDGGQSDLKALEKEASGL